MNPADQFIQRKLDERKANGTYRTLKPESGLIDFCSNDYLGFARSPVLKQWITEEINASPNVMNGSTGSRLLAGNLVYAEMLEQEIAAFHKSEAGLLFNSGYDANVGLLSALPQRGDTIIIDDLIHASIIDGARLSHANRYSFRHNNLVSLEEKLKHASGNIYVVIESVYSMDGDSPPITEILSLTEKYNAHLIVDEAHAVGLYDKGLVCNLNLEHKIFARLVTFGKALGCHGAIILGSSLLREYLVNFSRSFIYTTAASFHQLAAIKMAYKLLPHSESEIQRLTDNINLYKRLTMGIAGVMESSSAIQCIVAGSNEKANHFASTLQNTGLDIRPILSPTVAQGTERLRICLHSFNTTEQINLLSETIHQLYNA